MFSHPRVMGVSLSLFCALMGTAGEAKLGEDISKYKARVSKVYTAKGQSTKDNKTNYLFSINMDPQFKKAAPEFGGGLNITVDHGGKIIGESMVLLLGKNIEVGKTIAVRYALDFAYESLGRSLPKDRKEIAKEVTSYATVINEAFIGHSQTIRYPNVQGKLTISKQSDESLVFAATQN